MRPPQDTPSQPALSTSADLSGVIERFEDAWQQAPPEPDLAAFLPPAGDERRRAVVELAHIDLEYRLKAGQAARVEDYLSRFPELAGDETALSELIAAEYRLRVRSEPGLSAVEYLARFPHCREAVLARLPSAAEAPSTIRTSPPADVPPTRYSSLPPGTDATTVPPLPASANRYRLEEEIGRGGMGAVLRARDPHLNRELAVKVLGGDGHRHPELLRRFVEEAQVCSQLQHPAIVPVHDVGTLPDGRPFFAMKLVKGRTLAELLRDRPSPADDLPRYLPVFEQVCQAVAYAHSKGVIHRDLKPANVMVGAFGEVQVMDWGLAKVLRPQGSALAAAERAASVIRTVRSEAGEGSRDGQAMGTPAYMAPEQARGEVENLDERCDVFGLGAILCELLTGKPPFTGGSHEALMHAMGEHLGDALARLDGCGADAELVALAKACLAARPAGRPRDGGAVAAALTAYRESVQERLRRAELERAAEQARAEAAQAQARAERRARRLTLGLAAAGLALTTMLAAGWLWQQQQRKEQRQDVRGRLAQAVRLRQGGQFEEGLHLLEQTRQLLGNGGQDDLRRQVDQAVADTGLAKRLDEARQRALSLVDKKMDLAGAAQEYVAALREAGLGPENDPGAVAELVRASAVRAEIVAALDDWAGIDETRREWLLAVARAADPDPERDRLRQPELWRDGAALARLAGEVRVAELSPQLAAALGKALLKNRGEGLSLLREAQARHPHDLWLNFTLGAVLAEAKEHGESVGYLRAALALRPRSSRIHDALGASLAFAGKRQEAVAHFEQAVRLNPEYAQAQYNLATALKDMGSMDEAIHHFRRALELDPRLAEAHVNLGLALRGKGQVDEAIRHYEEALRLNPNLVPAHNQLGNALQAKGRLEDAIRLQRKALDIDPKYAPAHNDLGTALATKGETDEAIRHLEAAIRLDPKPAMAHYNLGLILFNKRKLDEAMSHLRQSLDIDPKYAPAQNQLGNALVAKGQVDKAVRCYEEALRLDPKYALAYNNLGNLLRDQGKVDEAIRLFREAARLDPKSVQAHGVLGAALLAQGRWAEARDVLRRCDALTPPGHPRRALVTRTLQLCERMLALEARLPAVLAGTDRPAGPAEWFDFAGVCQLTKRYAAAARLSAAAFAIEPKSADDLAVGRRYNAACWAALAAAGQGTDAPRDDKERARLRGQALGWLRADLTARAKQLNSWWPGAGEQAKTALRHWQKDADLIGVRDPQSLAGLPAAERAEWEKLWAEVAKMLRGPQADTKATAPARK